MAEPLRSPDPATLTPRQRAAFQELSDIIWAMADRLQAKRDAARAKDAPGDGAPTDKEVAHGRP